jgi:hypothetical protein
MRVRCAWPVHDSWVVAPGVGRVLNDHKGRVLNDHNIILMASQSCERREPPKPRHTEPCIGAVALFRAHLKGHAPVTPSECVCVCGGGGGGGGRDATSV